MGKNRTQKPDKNIEDYLRYDPELGKLFWIKNASFANHAGKIAGSVTMGRMQVAFNNKVYKVARVAWFLTYKYWPNFIDHIDGDPMNDKLNNLREVTFRENAQNTALIRGGRLQGAHYDKRDKAWRSSIKLNKKIVNLGTFKSEREAHEAYMVEFNKVKESERAEQCRKIEAAGE